MSQRDTAPTDLFRFDVLRGGEDVGVRRTLKHAVQGLELLLGEGVRPQVLPQTLHAALGVAARAGAVRAVWREKNRNGKGSASGRAERVSRRWHVHLWFYAASSSRLSPSPSPSPRVAAISAVIMR